MIKVKKSVVSKRLINSYLNGIAKTIDIDNSVPIFHVRTRASIKSAWKDVGIELTNVMNEYDKKHRQRV